MMKRNKLYTVNPWNKNLFLTGGRSFKNNVVTQGSDSNSYVKQYYAKSSTAGTNTVEPKPTALQQTDTDKSADSPNTGIVNTQSTQSTTKSNDLLSGLTSLASTAAGAFLGGSTASTAASAATSAAASGASKLASGASKAAGALGNASGSAGTGAGAGAAGASVGWSPNPYLAIAMNLANQIKLPDSTGEPARRGMFDSLDPMHNLAGKKSTKAGQVLGDIGVAAASTGIPYAMLAGAALKVAGDVIDLGWGYNIENEGAVKSNTNKLRNTNFNARDNRSLLQQYKNTGITQQGIGEVDEGWFTDSGTEEAERLQKEQKEAYDFAMASFENASKNIAKDELEAELRQTYGLGGQLDMKENKFPFGGLLDMPNDVSAVNYGFMTDYLTEKKRQNDLKNKMPGITQMPSFVPSYALGGDLQTNGGDWSTGLTHIEAGGTHEENPYEGVQIGVDREGIPNLVEEGEVVFNDYVYSQRLALDKNAKDKLHFPKKQDITYADAAKRLEREIKERPNDPISQAGFEAQMGDLAEEQERQKAEMEAAKAQEAFDSLSDEEKVAVMRQAAQQEQMVQQQAMQEQAMAEQAAAQQQLSPEEMAMMEQQAAQEQMMAQQAAPQGIPEEAMMGAYGGLINRFDLGGLAWIKKNHPEVKNPQAVAKALEKMMQANGRKYVTGTSTKDGRTIWDFRRAWSKMKSGSSLSSMENSFNEWVKYGLPREEAFKLSHPYSYYKEYKSDIGAERKRDYDAAYNRLVKDYKQPADAPKPQPVKQGNRTVYKTSTGKVFPTNKQASDYEKAYWRTINSERARQAAVQRAAAQPQAPVEEAPEKSAYRPPVAEAKAKPAARQATERQAAERQAAPAQRASRQATDGINVGTYRGEGNQWNNYGLRGLQYYLDNAILDYQGIEDPVEQRKKLQEIADTLNGVQESYYKNVAPTLGQSVQQKNKGVGEHQRLYQTVTNNEGFRGLDDAGNLIDLTDQAVVMPEGHNTTDNLANGWVDEYSGPKTWLRYLGASGDDLNDEVARLREIGIDFSPYQKWTIGQGDAARQLYRASLLDAANNNAAASDTPLQNNDGVVPVNEADYTFTEDELEAAGKKLDAQAKNNQGSVTAPDTEDWALKPVHRQDWMRYAGLFGPAVGLGMQALGIGKPDASGITATANAASGPAHLATPHLIGDYMRYTPFDRLFYSNQLQANARATDRALMNNSGANRGTAMAGLLANAYNTNNNLGNLFRQGDEYNRAQYERTKDFNRGTNQFNAQVLNQNSQYNAEAMNRQRQYAAQMQMQAAAQKAGMDADWYNGIYGNVAGLFKGLGDLGRENAQHNTVADMVATGIFGTIKNQPIANGFVEVVPKKYQSAKGGKIKRKKNKRGLTF